MCLKQLFGGISCFYHVVEIFRVFISTERMYNSYVGEGENSLLLPFFGSYVRTKNKIDIKSD